MRDHIDIQESPISCLGYRIPPMAKDKKELELARAGVAQWIKNWHENQELVEFLVRARAWVAGQVLGTRGN